MDLVPVDQRLVVYNLDGRVVDLKLIQGYKRVRHVAEDDCGALVHQETVVGYLRLRLPLCEQAGGLALDEGIVSADEKISGAQAGYDAATEQREKPAVLHE